MRTHSTPAVILLALAGLASAASPLEQKVLDLLESKCASCHAKGDEEPELSAKTDLAALRKNDEYVRAGDAEGSSLYQLVALPPGNKDRMPKSKASKPLPPLTAEEKKILADWITGDKASEAALASAARPFISNSYVASAVLADLKSAPGEQAKNYRYLSLANIYNERDASGSPLYSEQEMVYCRTGVTKMVNSLSQQPKIIPAKAVDAQEVVLRIYLPDYGLDAQLWSQVAAAYPYQVQGPKASQEMAEAQGITGVLPVMRADYFVFVFAQPPFYHKALGIPGGTGARGADVELEAKLGLSYDQAIQAPDAVRAGFQHSGVSQGNRLIERLPRPDGHYYWKSYDFDPNRQNERGADIFRSPLGPTNAALTDQSDLKFSADGGEILFSLPNRLQGYMLITASGKRLDEGPVNVVTDKNPESRGGRIINGISCIRCHGDGIFMTGVKDEILSASENLKLSAKDKATLQRLHNAAKLDSLMKADAARYAEAVAQCGPAPDGKGEPISMLYNHFAKSLSAGQLAGELGYEKAAIQDELASSSDPDVKTIAGKFTSKTPVPRIDFEKAFPAMVAHLNLGTVASHDRLSLTEYGGNLDNFSTQRDEASGVGVRAPIKNRDVKAVELGSMEDEDSTASTGIVVKPRTPASSARSVKKIRINPDGTIGKDEPPAPTAQNPAAAPSSTEKDGKKVIKIVTPKPGEDDFNTQSIPVPTVKSK